MYHKKNIFRFNQNDFERNARRHAHNDEMEKVQICLNQNIEQWPPQSKEKKNEVKKKKLKNTHRHTHHTYRQLKYVSEFRIKELNEKEKSMSHIHSWCAQPSTDSCMAITRPTMNARM